MVVRPSCLDERDGDSGAIGPVRIGTPTLFRSDEVALLVRETHGVDDALGRHDLREDRRAESYPLPSGSRIR